MHSTKNHRSSPEQIPPKALRRHCDSFLIGLLFVCDERRELRECAPGSRQLSATKIKEANSDQGGAIRHHGSRAPITGKIMNCVLVRTPFHLSRENPSCMSHHFP